MKQRRAPLRVGTCAECNQAPCQRQRQPCSCGNKADWRGKERSHTCSCSPVRARRQTAGRHSISAIRGKCATQQHLEGTAKAGEKLSHLQSDCFCCYTTQTHKTPSCLSPTKLVQHISGRFPSFLPLWFTKERLFLAQTHSKLRVTRASKGCSLNRQQNKQNLRKALTINNKHLPASLTTKRCYKK